MIGYILQRLLATIPVLFVVAVVVFLATALSQQPFLRKEESGGQHFYRPRDVDALLAHLELNPIVTEPVMTHQFKVRFGSAEEARDAARRIESVYAAWGYFTLL